MLFQNNYSNQAHASQPAEVRLQGIHLVKKGVALQKASVKKVVKSKVEAISWPPPLILLPFSFWGHTLFHSLVFTAIKQLTLIVCKKPR